MAEGPQRADPAAVGPACAARPPTPEPAPLDPVRAGRRRALRRTRTALSTVLLDMGGVVIPTLFESTAVPGFPAGPTGADAEYRAVEQGREQERDYWARLTRRRPDLDIGALWRDCSTVRAEIVGLLDRLAGRVRVVAFTNDMAHWFGDDWPARFPAVTRFDAVLEAAKLGVLKPDPAAFRAAAAALGEDPRRCLFVDDLAANLDGARAVGHDRGGVRRDRSGTLGRRRARRARPHGRTTPQAGVVAVIPELPPLRRPAGRYRGWVRTGDLLYLSGQGADGHVGRLGDDLTVEQGYAAARACALNLLAQAQDALGSLDRVEQVVQLRGFVTCTADFTDQPAVIDGASDLMAEVFGARGEHARTAIGVLALPKGFAVEVDAVVAIAS